MADTGKDSLPNSPPLPHQLPNFRDAHPVPVRSEGEVIAAIVRDEQVVAQELSGGGVDWTSGRTERA